jgi:preprotein translocase subunit SecY
LLDAGELHDSLYTCGNGSLTSMKITGILILVILLILVGLPLGMGMALNDCPSCPGPDSTQLLHLAGLCLAVLAAFILIVSMQSCRIRLSQKTRRRPFSAKTLLRPPQAI